MSLWVPAGIHPEAGMVDPSPGSPEAAEPLQDEEGWNCNYETIHRLIIPDPIAAIDRV
jgi:hypothetical protein